MKYSKELVTELYQELLSVRMAEEKLVEHVALRAAIEKLPERERQVVALRYYHGMTQQSCARVMRVSQVQISRLERRAVELLREYLREY